MEMKFVAADIPPIAAARIGLENGDHMADGQDSKHTIKGFTRAGRARPMPGAAKGRASGKASPTLSIGTTVVCAWCETLLVNGRTGVAYVVCSFCAPLVRAEMHGRMN